AAMEVWEHTSPSNMRDQWGMWYDWAIRSRLEPMKAAARMVKNHLGGIIHAATERITNASAEGLNSVIQKLKYVARGFRNRDRFRAAIYFHLGGLDLYPAGITR
ncbi:Transposase, partial [Nannocystis exedens]